jgi:hypothetical protein
MVVQYPVAGKNRGAKNTPHPAQASIKSVIAIGIFSGGESGIQPAISVPSLAPVP